MKNGDWDSYAGRLNWAMRRIGRTNQSELARSVGVKPQAIQYLCDVDAGAQGSAHTPALARELGVRAEWLARGDGQPLEAASHRVGEPADAEAWNGVLTWVAVHGAIHLLADGKQARRRPGQAEPASPKGVLGLPFAGEHCLAVQVKGAGLSPFAPEGHFLVLAPHAPLLPEDLVLITLRKGGHRLCRLLLDRDDSMVIAPWQGGPAEVVLPRDVTSVELVICAVAPRWFREEAG